MWYLYKSNAFIYRYKAAYCLYIHISIYIMRIAMCIIYVHDDVDVSAYVYVNEYVNVYDI